MSRTRPRSPTVETGLLLALGTAAIYLSLLPIDLRADRLPSPDLLYCLVAAWVIRRPRTAPLWALVGLGLAGDLLLSRPLGLGALGLVLAAELFRARAGSFHGGSFLFEWLAVSLGFAAMLAGQELVLRLAFTQALSPATALRYVVVTAAAYPIVVGLLTAALGLRAPRRSPSRLGRIR